MPDAYWDSTDILWDDPDVEWDALTVPGGAEAARPPPVIDHDDAEEPTCISTAVWLLHDRMLEVAP